MKKQNIVFIVSLILLIVIFVSKQSEKKHEEAEANMEEIDSIAIRYQSNCASCHGEKLNGFVDRKWKHGSERENIMASIKSGYLEAGMPSFDALFNEEERGELADFILNGVENAKKYNFDSVMSPIFEAKNLTVRLDTVMAGVQHPWGIAFLSEGAMLVTERSGKLYHISSTLDTTVVSGVPPVLAMGQGGLLDVELHPRFSENKLVYISYSKLVMEGMDSLSTTAVVKGKLNGTSLENVEELFEAKPALPTRHHYGSRLVFGNDGYLYFSVGDRGRRDENPQDLTKDPGKIHRIKDDGSIPEDNPFVHNDNANSTIYSYGHRNPQGLTKHPETGIIWENEHGPRGGDELNHIRPGLNFGWPVISYGINYDGTVFTTETAREGMEQPINYWVPSIAPSGFAIVTGDKYAAWKGDFLIGSLRFRYLNRVRMEDGKVIEEESLLKNIGRVRFVEMGPDGYIYVGVEEPGYVFRLLPQ
ncbi:MAG: PQQ-dependent sugar dehydrogenase [Cyclobacteriaceae bacterium]|nr:PQQ-dependent sugar dehydrogenase [Cyclobacteriaceae bacterium]